MDEDARDRTGCTGIVRVCDVFPFHDGLPDGTALHPERLFTAFYVFEHQDLDG